MFGNFPLDRVVLHDREFAGRRKLVKDYVAGFDVNRLMHMFRLNAGIASEAEPLGGWEAPDCGLRGHFTGHYLSACAKFAFADKDRKLKEKADEIVDIMKQCAKPNGYLSAFGEEILDVLEYEENRNVWAPYYTLHKILQGLVDCAILLENTQALVLAVNLADYIYHRFRKLSYWKIDGILRCTKVNPVNEFGGIGDTLYTLYEVTGKDWILELAELFDRDYFTGRIGAGEDILENLHSNTHLPMIIAAMHRFTITGEVKYKTTALNFYEYLRGRTFANGNNSSKATAFIEGMVSEKSEHWGCFQQMEDALTGGESESCCAHNTEKIVQNLFAWTGNADYLDHMECLKYNAVLNSTSSKTGLSQYHQPLGTGAMKKFSEPYESFWCCTASGVEAMSELQKNIWFTQNDSLLVQAYISSTVFWAEKGLKITQCSDYPDTLVSFLKMETDKPVECSIYLRKNTVDTVRINGELVQGIIENGYIVINRLFEDKDTMEIKIHAKLRLVNLQGSESLAALMYGNILLAALGEIRSLSGMTKDNILSAVKRLPGKEIKFELTDRDGKKQRFLPLYRVETEKYTVYLNLSGNRETVSTFSFAEDGSAAYG